MNDKPKGTIYTGVTSDLVKRVYEHKNGITSGFTKQYELKNLVYYEVHDEIEQAILREKRIKNWKRIWKLEMIYAMNPEWRDLWSDITGDSGVRQNDS